MGSRNKSVPARLRKRAQRAPRYSLAGAEDPLWFGSDRAGHRKEVGGDNAMHESTQFMENVTSQLRPWSFCRFQQRKRW